MKDITHVREKHQQSKWRYMIKFIGKCVISLILTLARDNIYHISLIRFVATLFDRGLCDVSWRLKSLTTRLLIQQLVKVHNKGTNKGPHYSPCVRGIHRSVTKASNATPRHDAIMITVHEAEHPTGTVQKPESDNALTWHITPAYWNSRCAMWH